MQTNKDKAIRFLETVQAESLEERYGENYIKQLQSLNENFENNRMQIAEQIRGQNGDLTAQEEAQIEEFLNARHEYVINTKYESPHNHRILVRLVQQLGTSFQKMFGANRRSPYFGSAHSREYNAFAAKVPDSEEYVIVFEAELFILSNLLAKTIAACLPDFQINTDTIEFNVSKDRIRAHIEAHPDLRERFADLVYNGIYLGQPTKTKQYLIDPTVQRLQYEFMVSIELFIVGHEFGHVHAGHLDEKNLMTRISRDKRIQAVSVEWEMEYEADYWGVHLLLASLPEEGLMPFNCLGPELFFTFLDIDERANALLSKGVESKSAGSDSHPPAQERRRRIRNILLKELPEQMRETYLGLSEFIEDVLEVQWEAFKKNPTFGR